MMRQWAKQTVGSTGKQTSALSHSQQSQVAVKNGTSNIFSAHTARAYYSNNPVHRIRDGPTTNIPPFPHFPIPRVSTSNAAAKDLVDWIVTHKGFINQNLHVGCIRQFSHPDASDDGNWGLVMKEDIPANTIIATVPVPLCLFPSEKTSQIPNAPSQFDQPDHFYQGVAGLLSAVNLNFWQLRLGIRLLAERAADKSFFSPYINSLPSNFPSHPFFFSRDAANALQYLPIQKELGVRSRTLHALAKHFTVSDPNVAFNQLPPLTRLAVGTFNGFQPSAADLAWATAAVGSRAFISPLTPSTSIGSESEALAKAKRNADAKCLIPLIDMSNHSFSPNCKTSFMATEDGASTSAYNKYHVVLRSTREIKKGEEISLNYFRPSSLTNSETDDIASMFTQMTIDMSLGRQSAGAQGMRQVFGTSILNAPGYSVEGSLSDASNDEILLSYGFVPEFNGGDIVSLSESIALFATSLEMANDITISAENEFDEDPLNAATPVLSEDEAEPELDADGLPALDPMFTEADRIVNEAKINKAKLMKPTINVVLPAVADQNQAQKDILEDLPLLGTLALSYKGPNDLLLALMRVMVLGARTPGEGTVEEIRDRDFAKAEHRARSKLESMGDEKAFDRQLHPSEWILGFGTEEPISEANEKAAMAVLYHMLVMASASFPHKLHNDGQLLSTAIRKRAEDEYTAIRFSRGKKQLISHSMKVLASELNLDDNLHKWHFLLD